MPAKLERCVEEIMKKQNVSEERAWAICNASISDGLVIDSYTKIIGAVIDEQSGFLTAPVVLSRVGVQYYMGYELGLTDDRAFKKIGVFRSPEEVFHPDSIKSLNNMVVSDDHPLGLVTVSNVKDLQVGMVSGPIPNKEKGSVGAVITITDPEEIKKVQDGKKEVSVGYTQELIEEKGSYNGESYDFKQTKIRGNHLAIVDAGRCGPDCRIVTDHKKGEKTMIKITLDGITFSVEDEQLAQAIMKQQNAWDAEKEAMEKKVEDLEEENEEMKKKVSTAEAAKDAAIKEKLTDEQLNSLVNDMAVLLSDARSILGDNMPECGVCPKEIKAAVIDHVFGETDLSGKNMDYITAMYDMVVKKFKENKVGFESFKKKMKKETKDSKTTVTRDGARAGYMKTLGLEVD